MGPKLHDPPSRSIILLLLPFLSSLSPASSVDPRYGLNITVYHEFQPQYESLGLVDQDTGDLAGDAYFVLRSLILPVECAAGHPWAPKFDCDNPEANSTSNIVSQHTVLVDSRFGTYGSCNIKDGEYHCQCPGEQECGPSVGRDDVRARELGHPHPRAGAPQWEWWRLNLAVKTGGYWYSTPKAGDCSGGNCTWQLVNNTPPRRIVAKCLETRVATALQRQDRQCFTACPQPQNASSACVVECYMQTLLGPHGGSRLISDGEGTPMRVVNRAWAAAFASSDTAIGGCPDAPDALM